LELGKYLFQVSKKNYTAQISDLALFTDSA
jgi:hypothetical protein